MDWTQAITVIGVLSTLIIWAVNKLDTDIKGLSDRIDKVGVRLDGHAQRIDQLYHMFIDLIKEGKNDG